MPEDEKTSSGLDRGTLQFLEDFYATEIVKPVPSLIDSVKEFEKEPEFKNYLVMLSIFKEIEANLIRRNVFRTHNQ